jgi:hypothetical protein
MVRAAGCVAGSVGERVHADRRAIALAVTLSRSLLSCEADGALDKLCNVIASLRALGIEEILAASTGNCARVMMRAVSRIARTSLCGAARRSPTPGVPSASCAAIGI